MGPNPPTPEKTDETPKRQQAPQREGIPQGKPKDSPSQHHDPARRLEAIASVPCYHAIPAYQLTPGQPVRLNPPIGTANLAIPCGKCLGCKANHAMAWAARCGHEATAYRWNSFITLTYDDKHLPDEAQLQASDLTNFIKRARNRANRHGDSLRGDRTRSFKYFACGEYGEKNDRPHYHALMFNVGFTDEKRVGGDQYESATLNALWGMGRATFAYADPPARAAGYIAKYALKNSRRHGGLTDDNGVWKPAPFLRMSKGLGNEWLEKYSDDLKLGYLEDNGRKQPIPRAYLKRLAKLSPAFAEEVTARKAKQHMNNPTDRNTPERLHAQEVIHKQQKQQSETKRQL